MLVLYGSPQAKPRQRLDRLPLVEVIPGKVSGVSLVKGTRMPADGILSNFQTGSPVEEIAEIFYIPEDIIRALLSYAAERNPALTR